MRHLRTRRGITAILYVAAFVLGTADAAERPTLSAMSFMQLDEAATLAKGKPNEESRLHGLKAYQRGDTEDAVQRFERAAYHADKPAQHYLSLIHWHGAGVPVDRVLGYIWSDLAAERGSQRLLRIRERMWSELSADEQAQVASRGESFAQRYGDAVARPRAESRLRTFARAMTGSRVGWRGQRLETRAGSSSGSFDGPGSGNQLYAVASADRLYGELGGLSELNGYWEREDRMLEGSVEAGPLRPVATPPSPPEPSSR
ncbi:SEL1-like repeat protein [Montanilutibacter psychrotolerans]|uniref:Sel1 repeat family protein n=1 Tax=Montanilutibacter psychrotolerans TaxID=1327343 RepID=A0A3M8SR67_9GAMM|nr:SEL1-like repeat protein [Lysobacter psychrotolerans]RNF83779.1 hypothetical protein EER27_10445 [Lysobacter psychrotolerans]